MSSIAEIKARLKAKPCGFCMNDFDLTGEIPDACRECHAPPQDNIEDDYHRGWLPNRDADAIALLLSEIEQYDNSLVTALDEIGSLRVENSNFRSALDSQQREVERLKIVIENHEKFIKKHIESQ